MTRGATMYESLLERDALAREIRFDVRDVKRKVELVPFYRSFQITDTVKLLTCESTVCIHVDGYI